MTASLLGPLERQNTFPDSASSHALSKWTPSADSRSKSAWWAAFNCSSVTPTKPLWTSMNFGIWNLLCVRRVPDRTMLGPHGPDDTYEPRRVNVSARPGDAPPE